MGKDDKEDSGFGFKDKAKAEETLRLLEQHELNYRRLTVRGLLGRAKRVLSMTKAEDKIKNIKEAMEVFENWIAELDGNKEKKPEKKKEQKKEEKMDVDDDKESGSDEEKLPSESVPGLGFKDKEAANNSLKVLEGRDPDYQLLAVKGLIGRAKRVLTCTRDENKLSNIKEAISVLEQFTEEFDSRHMSRQTCPYLSVGYVRTANRLAETVSQQQKSFIAAYESVRGEHKRLRNVPEKEGGQTWDIVRNTALKQLKETYKDAKLFNTKGEPTKEHLDYILWAYSPEPAQLKKVIQYTKEEESDEEKKDKSEKRDNKSEKRDDKSEKRDDNSEKREGKEKAEKRKRSSSDDDSPSKKKKE